MGEGIPSRRSASPDSPPAPVAHPTALQRAADVVSMWLWCNNRSRMAVAIQVSARGDASSGRTRWGSPMRSGRTACSGYARLMLYGVQAGPVE